MGDYSTVSVERLAELMEHRRPCVVRLHRTMQPSKVARPPSGPLWVHEIKHDGYQLMVRRDGLRVRRFTCGGHDWADRFPTIVNAALRIKTTSPGESSAAINWPWSMRSRPPHPSL